MGTARKTPSESEVMDKSGQMGSGQVDRQSGKPQQQVQSAGGRRTAPQAGQASDQPQQMGGSGTITDWASI